MPRNGLKREEFLKTLPALAAVPRLREARIKITDVRIVPLRTIKDLGSFPGMPPRLLPAVKNLLVGADRFDVDLHAERLYGLQGGTGYRGSNRNCSVGPDR